MRCRDRKRTLSDFWATYAIGPLSCLDALGMEVGLDPGHIVFFLDGNLALPRKGYRSPSSTFLPMSIVAKRSPISATTELLSVLSSGRRNRRELTREVQDHISATAVRSAMYFGAWPTVTLWAIVNSLSLVLWQLVQLQLRMPKMIYCSLLKNDFFGITR